MSTEYRRGIPSTPHVEAATRLELLWHREGHPPDTRTKFALVRDVVESNYGSGIDLESHTNAAIYSRENRYSYLPIRPDGTPVDWEVLDQEVARVGQQGQPATVTPTASAAPTTQPQGFRADLWRRICDAFFPHAADAGLTTNDFNRVTGLDATHLHMRSSGAWSWANAASSNGRADILARWTVYQELKPLYDLVDGAQGEAAMPRDVEAEWFTAATMPVPASGHWFLCCDVRGIHTRNHSYVTWRPEEVGYGVPLRNFAAVLDAVAERRVAERMRSGRTVTSAQPEPVLNEAALRSLILNLPNVAAITNRIERGSRQRDRYIVRVRLADPNVPLDRALAAQIPRNVHVHCNGHGAGGQRGVGGTAAAIYSPTGNRDAVAPPIQETRRVNVEPRSFADVRPDRHGWRWWRVISWTNGDIEIQPNEWRWHRGGAEWHPWGWGYTMDTWMSQTVIPTDEQGNPVSWEAIVSVGTVQSVNSDGTVTVRLNDDGSVSPAREGEAGAIRARWAAPEGFYMPAPITAESFARVLQQMDGARSVNAAQLHADTIRYCEQQISQAIIGGDMPLPAPEEFRRAANLFLDTLNREAEQHGVPGIHVTVGTGAKPAQTETTPLPRFTADELDDVDHSKTSKLDEVTLRRGKLPTVEQIAKYREVRARRTGTVADALKESRIDCEVAQYVLERWAGGLGDEESRVLIETASRFGAEHKVGTHLPAFAVDSRIRWYTQNNQTLDTSEKPSPTVQRGRQEAEERRQRLAELRQRLAAERAAQPQEMARESEGAVSRFDLIEPDPQADPAASIRAWEARQAAVKVRPVAIPAKPAAAPRRPAIEVVDAEVDGLSRSEAFTALFGRALNGGC